MVLYSILVYDRNGNCIYFHEHNKEDQHGNPIASRRNLKQDDIEAEQKLLYGLIFSMKAFVTKISPKQTKTFHSFSTSTYKLHHYETPTGYKFLAVTDPSVGNILDSMKHIYKSIFVPYVSSNPLYQMQPGDRIESQLFIENLNSYLKSMNWYQ